MAILIPARNSRHRFACLALYRALLRSARDIEVSADLPAGVRDPMRWLIRGQFRRNKADVSPRLVYASLSAGYKFLDLFAKAKVNGSPEHASVVEHVRSRLGGLEAWRSHKPAPPAPAPAAPPLLTRLPPRTDDPDEEPVYVSTLRPRPLDGFRGTRKIPRLCATTFGVPFLRLAKPQPVALGNKLRSMNQTAQARQELMSALRDVLIPEAAGEDAWERDMRELARGAGAGPGWDGGGDDRGATYAGCLREVGAVVEGQLTRARVHNIARARAMLDIVKQEKALAEMEAREGLGDDARG